MSAAEGIRAGVRAAMVERGLTVAQFAIRARVPKRTVERLLYGDGDPSVETLRLICEGHGLSADELLGLSGGCEEGGS